MKFLYFHSFSANLLIANLKRSKNENPMKRPRDPPTADRIAEKSKRRTSSMMVTSVVENVSHIDVNIGIFVPFPLSIIKLNFIFKKVLLDVQSSVTGALVRQNKTVCLWVES